ncbi:MAG: acyl-CoA dehydrogenase family protein [Myxococcales bacterium]|nr:acyl-CoA dehydrogenase family protein [Myxococcales bacterium]
MFKWSDSHKQLRMMLRKFVDAEVVPQIDAIEHEGAPPYDVLRKFWKTFGIGDMLVGEYKARRKKAEARAAAGGSGSGGGEAADAGSKKKPDPSAALDQGAMRALPIIELSRHSAGMVTALGVSMGLTPNAIIARGTPAQQDAYVPALLTLDKIGAWAITEPGSGSDAFGAMRATAKPDGDDHFILNGNKTFITNGPYADVIIFICKLDRGEPPERRKIVSFILDGEMEGLERSKPLRKMGLHGSPTGEIFASDLRVPISRLVGERVDDEDAGSARDDAKKTFTAERSGVLAMALGMIERAQELSLEYARTRVQFGKPIGERQLIQLKLAKMEVARQNVENMLFKTIESTAHGEPPDIAAASAGKLYAAQAAMEVCLEAVQVFGGNGYMAEYRVEQLARDAKVLQIYGGTDEIQVSQIARSLLWR